MGILDDIKSAQGIATPSFSGAPIPGAQTQDPNQKLQGIMEMFRQAAARKQFAGQAIPQTPEYADPNAAGRARAIGMQTGNPHAWGSVRFMAGLGPVIQNAVAAKKQRDVQKAEGDWTTMAAYLNELYAAQQGDPNDPNTKQAVAAAQKKVDFFFQDEKKLKNMAKALNQDWLNPEKTTVHGEALKNVAQQQEQKGQAQQGLKGLISKILGQNRQMKVQLNDAQRQAMAREIEARAPTGTPGLGGQQGDAAKFALEQMKEEAAAARQQEKEEATAKERRQEEEARRQEDQYKVQMAEQRQETHEAFQRQIQNAQIFSMEQRDQERYLALLEREKMKDARDLKKDRDKMAKDAEKEVNDSISSMNKQLAQEQQNLRSVTGQEAAHWWKGPGKQDVADARDRVDALKRAVDYMEKNRDAAVKGKADWSQVTQKAYELMGAGPETPTPPPGFKPVP